MNHAKLLIVDGHFVSIGSANLDPRALRIGTGPFEGQVAVLVHVGPVRIQDGLRLDIHQRDQITRRKGDDCAPVGRIFQGRRRVPHRGRQGTGGLANVPVVAAQTGGLLGNELDLSRCHGQRTARPREHSEGVRILAQRRLGQMRRQQRGRINQRQIA